MEGRAGGAALHSGQRQLLALFSAMRSDSLAMRRTLWVGNPGSQAIKDILGGSPTKFRGQPARTNSAVWSTF